MKEFFKNVIRSKWVALLFVFVIVTFYLMNVFVPFFSDDIEYMYHPGANGYEKYQHFSDVIKDTYISYFYNNGRLLCSFLIILYSGVLGDVWFNVINTITFVLMIFFIGYYTIPKGTENKLGSWIIIILSFYIFTQGNRTYCLYYWGAGAGTYIVSGLVSIVYMILLRKLSQEKQASLLTYFLLMIVGFILGFEHEMLAFALSGATFLYYAFHRKEITRPLVVFYIAFVIGFIINAMSPAILERGGLDKGTPTISTMWAFMVKNMIEAKAFYLLILCIVVAKFKGVRIYDFIHKNILPFWALVLSFFPLMFTGQGGRALFGVEFFSIVLMSSLVCQMYNKDRKLHQPKWSMILTCLFVLYFSTVTYESYKKWNMIRDVMGNYFKSPNETQYFEAYKGTPLTDYYSIDLANFFGNYGTRVRMQDVKQVEYGQKSAKLIQAVPSLNALKIIQDCSENLNPSYKIPGDMEAYDYPELDFLLIQCDSIKLQKVYDHKIEKKIHLSFLPQFSFASKNSHKYMFEINDDDLKYKYLMIKKSFSGLKYDNISISKEKCPREGVRRIKGA